MKIGVVYPQVELGGDPRGVREIGLAAEELGFDHFLMYDHVVGAARENREPPLWERAPYTEQHPFHDPFTAFSYLSAITTKINFITGILILPQRQTVLVAKQATDVDLFSGARLSLGVGTGWNYVEYDALGQDFSRRGARLSEQIEFLRRLWSEPVVSFQGKFDAIDRGAVIPRPKRKIPILCGGFVEAAFRRAAKLADGFMFGGSYEDMTLPYWKRVQQLLKKEGRSIDEFLAYQQTQNYDTTGKTPQEAADTIKQWQDAGGTHSSILTMGREYKEIEQHIDHLVSVKQLLGSL